MFTNSDIKNTLALREKCLYLEFSWSIFSPIRTEYEEILVIDDIVPTTPIFVHKSLFILEDEETFNPNRRSKKNFETARPQFSSNCFLKLFSDLK